MMKKILFLIAIMVLHSCASTKNSNDNWIGQSKKSLIKSWGTPIRTLNNAEQGEILIYGEQVYENANNNEGSRIAGPNYWNYRYIYINKEGKIYSYKTDTQQHTPQEIAVK
ncbi:hypothetical protein [Flavobacterium aquidurense]|uniref:Lipoprotein n=1 Tax=Flavobacterium aquidurense TaxID=362413 RepID=A0A0Q0WPR3_9FLAO|nr:hypothetical protein [Flavobacterium aquidurense]KQB37771.1 hypothetical protein RC62_2937 [Flavobacterium aquidurense]